MPSRMSFSLMMKEEAGADGDAVAQLRALFNKHDTNQDGELQPDEFYKLGKSIGLSSKKKEMVRPHKIFLCRSLCFSCSFIAH